MSEKGPKISVTAQWWNSNDHQKPYLGKKVDMKILTIPSDAILPRLLGMGRKMA
ncbi:hypothetical protein [Paenibacillus xylanexedens]|uniref:hypothetical protein n=1 Tax=Paenibacillus xylanexedens TaxID=528191 RepID=UPI001642829C|nr:hypothetical protein [Paenibacillus xylanexedens]